MSIKAKKTIQEENVTRTYLLYDTGEIKRTITVSKLTLKLKYEAFLLKEGVSSEEAFHKLVADCEEHQTLILEQIRTVPSLCLIGGSKRDGYDTPEERIGKLYDQWRRSDPMRQYFPSHDELLQEVQKLENETYKTSLGFFDMKKRRKL